MMKMKRAMAIACSVMLTLILFSPQVLPGQSYNKLKANVKELTLANGMKFIVMKRDEAPVVSFHVYADVGSAQELNGITGISHILEHMAFKGTKTVGTKDYATEAKILEKMDPLYDLIVTEEDSLKPDNEKLKKMKEEFEQLQQQAKELVVNNEYFDMMMQQGDAGVNAYTSNDATQYINSLPANKTEFWMAMSSDRFLNPIFREFYKERDVIMEERRLGLETQPIGKLIEDFFATAFKAHPYHHSVVGHMSDLKRITHQDVINYFKKYYSPSNLTVAIVGDVNPDEILAMAKLYFERIPSGPRPQALRTKEPEQWGERHVKVEAQSQPILVIGYHRPSSVHEDNTALEALANIFGQGRSSRIWEVLVKKEKVAAACGSFNGWPGDKYDNLIAAFAVPNKDRTAQECLALIEKEIEKIKTEPVTSQELIKFKQTKKKEIIDRLRSNDNLAALLTYFDVVHGDWRLTFDEIKKIDTLTVEKIKEVANRYLIQKNRIIGEIVPEKQQ